MTLSYAFADRDSVLLIDSRGVLYAFDPKSEVLEYIADIRNEIEHYARSPMRSVTAMIFWCRFSSTG